MTPRLAPHQAALYAAEDETIAHLGVRWRRCGDAQAYLDRLIASAWFFEHWPGFLRCRVARRGAGSRWSTCERFDTGEPAEAGTGGVILVADGCLTQPVVLHELAHLLLPPDVGHHPAFAETLLTLVRREMGFFAFADLSNALRRSVHFRTVGGRG